jgi:UDP-N-acetylglucosamine diphosphorylase/glucosamine-1-phosphate N-acetyltransferase
MISLLQDTHEVKDALYPFTGIKPSFALRSGILTIREKWNYLLGNKVSTIDWRDREKVENPTASFAIPGNWVPSNQAAQELLKGNLPAPEKVLTHPIDLISINRQQILNDYLLITQNRESAPIPQQVSTHNKQHIFIEAGAELGFCILNASDGPIYIGKNTQIMDGCTIRGPFALCEGAKVKMGARIYEGTTIGPYSVVGGEIKNCLIMGYSNKAHEGYLGDAVIGEWCNLGAGTSASNVSNTGGEVKVWSKAKRDFMNAGQKCGLIMGDYSRSAINTSFNTGTLVGISSNVFGAGLTPKYIPDFTWGMNGEVVYDFEKALRDIGNWKKMKNKSLEPNEITALRAIFEQRPEQE